VGWMMAQQVGAIVVVLDGEGDDVGFGPCTSA
jgi:hypothetical protein